MILPFAAEGLQKGPPVAVAEGAVEDEVYCGVYRGEQIEEIVQNPNDVIFNGVIPWLPRK